MSQLRLCGCFSSRKQICGYVHDEKRKVLRFGVELRFEFGRISSIVISDSN